MIKNTMSLKAKINNIAKKEKVSPQAVMQTYMLERLLERISNQVLRAAIIETSKHRDSYKIINDKDNVEEIISFIKNDDSLKNQ